MQGDPRKFELLTFRSKEFHERSSNTSLCSGVQWSQALPHNLAWRQLHSTSCTSGIFGMATGTETTQLVSVIGSAPPKDLPLDTYFKGTVRDDKWGQSRTGKIQSAPQNGYIIPTGLPPQYKKLVADCVRDPGTLIVYGALSSNDVTCSIYDLQRGVKLDWFYLGDYVPTRDKIDQSLLKS